MNWKRIGPIMGATLIVALVILVAWPQMMTSPNPLKIVGVAISLGMIGHAIIQRLQ